MPNIPARRNPVRHRTDYSMVLHDTSAFLAAMIFGGIALLVIAGVVYIVIGIGGELVGALGYLFVERFGPWPLVIAAIAWPTRSGVSFDGASLRALPR